MGINKVLIKIHQYLVNLIVSLSVSPLFLFFFSFLDTSIYSRNLKNYWTDLSDFFTGICPPWCALQIELWSWYTPWVTSYGPWKTIFGHSMGTYYRQNYWTEPFVSFAGCLACGSALQIELWGWSALGLQWYVPWVTFTGTPYISESNALICMQISPNAYLHPSPCVSDAKLVIF